MDSKCIFKPHPPPTAWSAVYSKAIICCLYIVCCFSHCVCVWGGGLCLVYVCGVFLSVLSSSAAEEDRDCFTSLYSY